MTTGTGNGTVRCGAGPPRLVCPPCCLPFPVRLKIKFVATMSRQPDCRSDDPAGDEPTTPDGAPSGATTPRSAAAQRRERQAAALRDNLRKRKQQARARATPSGGSADAPQGLPDVDDKGLT
ncbi:MAG: hypothetical protein P4M00_08045 [Azospirillaceae bacterium]|nr:hypothetical protein [Azospirillaceae bacterium]